jgi:DNA-binding transcriptional regulator PaaX
MAQLAKSLGWQPHTVRAAISRLRKSGADVSIDKSGKVSAYRIADVA